MSFRFSIARRGCLDLDGLITETASLTRLMAAITWWLSPNRPNRLVHSAFPIRCREHHMYVRVRVKSARLRLARDDHRHAR